MSRDSVICGNCKLYKKNSLNKMLSRFHLKASSSTNKENLSSHMNYRYMDSESKDKRMKCLRSELRKKTGALKQMGKIVNEVIRKSAVSVDADLHSDLLDIMSKHSHSSDQFKEMFWLQQKQAFSQKTMKSMRWHPTLIKWCLYLHHKSSGAYEMLRNSGVICLPSGRTLRDYRNFAPVSPGLSISTDKQLVDLANKNSESHGKYVSILIDEMYVKEGLVFDKHNGQITGFIDLGEINNYFTDLENIVSEVARENIDQLPKRW